MLSGIVAGVGYSVSVGLEAVSILWKYTDEQERQLHAAAVVLRGTEKGARAAPRVPELPQVVLGAEAASGAGQLVCAGGASGEYRLLAARRDIAAADGGATAVVDGQTGALAAMAAVG